MLCNIATCNVFKEAGKRRQCSPDMLFHCLLPGQKRLLDLLRTDPLITILHLKHRIISFYNSLFGFSFPDSHTPMLVRSQIGAVMKPAVAPLLFLSYQTFEEPRQNIFTLQGEEMIFASSDVLSNVSLPSKFSLVFYHLSSIHSTHTHSRQPSTLSRFRREAASDCKLCTDPIRTW